jgi:hypothetical protein
VYRRMLCQAPRSDCHNKSWSCCLFHARRHHVLCSRVRRISSSSSRVDFQQSPQPIDPGCYTIRLQVVLVVGCICENRSETQIKSLPDSDRRPIVVSIGRAINQHIL